MTHAKIMTEDEDIKQILDNSRTIAILGLSPKPQRDSYRVAKYLQQHGYTIIPVRPGQKQILGEKAYSSLTEIKCPVDIVDVFRNSAQILPHAEEALQLRPKMFWMQLDIENQEAAGLLTGAEINVGMNRCLKIEHARLCA